MTQIGNKHFHNIAAAGETPIYQRTGGGTSGGEIAQAGDEAQAYYPEEKYATGLSATIDNSTFPQPEYLGTNVYNSWKKLIEYYCPTGGTYRVYWVQVQNGNTVYSAQSALYLNEQLTDSANIITVLNKISDTGKTVDLNVQAGDYIAIYGKCNHPDMFETGGGLPAYSQSANDLGSSNPALRKIKISTSNNLMLPPRLVYTRFSRGFTGTTNNWFRNP